MKIVISKAGTMFQVGKTSAKVMLRDDNCVWYNDEIHMTKKGREDFLENLDYLSESIDKMRDL